VALPAWARGVQAALPGAAAARFAKLTLKSESAAVKEVSGLHLKLDEIPKAVAGIYTSSPAKAATFTKGVIANWKSDEQAVKESHAMFGWAHKAGRAQRLMLIRAMNQKKRGIQVVDNVAECSRDDARMVMKEFLAEGGKVEDVLEWMRACGEFLRKEGGDPETDTDLIGLIKKGVKAVAQGLKTIGDALKSAVKNLGQAIKKVLGWTAAQLRDLVVGLVKAGRKVAEILGEALKHGASAMGKFIRAVLDAGRRVAEVVEWAAKQSLNTLKSALQAIKAAGKHVAQIVMGAVEKGAAIVGAIVKGLLQIGEKIATLISSIAQEALSAVKLVTDALLKAGKSVLEIVNTAVQHALAGVGKVVQSLLQLGRTVAQVLGEVALKITPFFLRPVVNGILQAGRKLSEVISAAASKGIEVLKRVAEAAVGLTSKIGEVLGAIANGTVSAMTAVIQGVVAAKQKLSKIVAEIRRFVGEKLRKLVQALYQAVKKVGEILVEFARDALGTIRTVLEGLFAAGVSLGAAIKSIVTDVGEAFRKGFFQGLIALAKSPALIMGEALKFAGSVAALAFAVLLEVLGSHRGLTAEEKKQARRIFGESIDLDRVKVTVKSIPVDLISKVNKARPFTTMYVLNFASWKPVDMKTLIHELAHVWQAVQVGPVYMLEAIHAQMKEGKDAYKVTDEMLREGGNKLSSFNREQQAVIAEEYWFNRFGAEVFANPSSVSNRGLSTALLEPYALQFKSKRAPIVSIAAVTAAVKATQPRLVRLNSATAGLRLARTAVAPVR
jgi:uncharacterized protein with HEPN domain